jgi:hypothetical protein
VLGAEVLDLSRRGDLGERGDRHPHRREPPPHDELVLRVDERVRVRPDRHAVRHQRAQVLLRHALVVEGHGVAPHGERAQRLQVRPARHDVRRDQRRGLVRLDGEHPQRLPQPDRGLVRHPGELSAADHPDDREVT